MTTQRTLLSLESLDDRRVPATLNLTTQGAQGVLDGAMFQQLDAGALGSTATHEFLRLQERTFFGSLFTPEEGYNTNARPLQYDATGDTSVTHSLLLKDIPLVTIGGVQYREFLLTVNQPQGIPNIDLRELRIFLGSAGDLTGYNANTHQLAGMNAAYDLDAVTNNTVRISDALNRTSSPDVRVLIPNSVFGASDPNSTFVYLYSKFEAFIGTTYLSGAESWSVADIPVPPPPPPTSGSLSGHLFIDGNGNGTYDSGEGFGGLTVTLSGTDAFGNNLFPDGDLTVFTGSDGSYDFGNLGPGTYFISVTGQNPGDSFAPILGTTTDSQTYDGDLTGDGFAGIQLSQGEVGTNYDVGYTPFLG
ncbi:MAG TPA: SdrD B-like domain-containing protein [Gemmata sp.]|nr:SdrD B-like domain-containing protein [Gemmata sp.]